MKRTLIALTTLVAATVGFQGQAQAGNNNLGLSIEFALGDGLGVRIGNGVKLVDHRHRSHRRHGERRGYNRHHHYQDRHGYKRRHRCFRSSKRSIRRSLRHRGFHDIHRVRKHGRIFSAKAVSPRGYLVKLKINGCNHRIVKRRIIRL